MHPSTSNLLYRRPELYELLYPETDEATPRFCQRLFTRYLERPPASILDIGCGTARDLNVLSRTYADCWGVDYLEENIAYAQRVRPHLHLSVGDMRFLRLGRTFSVIQSLGSTLMYALENSDIEKTFETFRAHAEKGTLLILDLNNASGFLPGGACTMERTYEINSPGFSARAQVTHHFDRVAQHFIRKRTWFISGEEVVEDFCRYRMFFPAELKDWLRRYSFEVQGLWDNKDLQESELTQPTLYVAAIYQPA
jgi:SAM-dependent methyltransferase